MQPVVKITPVSHYLVELLRKIFLLAAYRRQHFKCWRDFFTISIIYSDCTENSCVISPRSCQGLYNLAVYNVFGSRHLGAFLVSEMLFSPRSRQGFLAAFLSHVAEISPLISPRFWPPRFSSHRDLATNLGAFLAAEISPLISARF